MFRLSRAHLLSALDSGKDMASFWFCLLRCLVYRGFPLIEASRLSTRPTYVASLLSSSDCTAGQWSCVEGRPGAGAGYCLFVACILLHSYFHKEYSIVGCGRPHWSGGRIFSYRGMHGLMSVHLRGVASCGRPPWSGG